MASKDPISLNIKQGGTHGKGIAAKLKTLRNNSDVKGYKIGWPADATYPDGTPVAEVALYNEFGTPDATNPIPERPFFRRANRHFSRIAGRLITKFVKDGQITRSSTHKLAQAHQRLVQESIVILQSPPNAEATVAQKGSSNPLIDTGLMRRTINHELIGK